MKSSMKKIISAILVLVLVFAMAPMAFAWQWDDPIDGPIHGEINAIVTANQTIALNDELDVYCTITGVDYDVTYIGTSIQWYSSNPDVIRIVDNPTESDTVIGVKAVGTGSATISASVTVNYMNGVKAYDYDTTTITVTGTGIEVSPWTKSINVGESFDLSVKGVGFGGKISYFSDNPSVATVDSYGRVTGKGAGTTNIWAEWAGYSDYCSVNVKGSANIITALTPTTQSRNVNLGTSQADLKNNFDTIYGYYTDAHGTYRTVACPVSWSSYNYNPNTAGVYTFNGTVSAPKGYQLAGNLSNTVTATVTVVKSYSLVMSLTPSTFRVGETATLTVKLTDANGRGVSTIGGANVQIALDYAYGCVTLSKYYMTLNSNGTGSVTVTGVSKGTETITAVAWGNGQEICGTGAYVTVDAASSQKLPFVDVPNGAWYYDDLVSVVNMGLINGKTPYQYKPDDNMTYAEAIKIAACMNQYYYNGRVTLTNGTGNWYDTYVTYAKNNGIPCAYTDLNAKITRADYVHIFYNALPASCFEKINYIAAVPDMAASNAAYSEVLALYNAGVLTGSDSYGNFNPFSYIKRSEVVTIIARMMDNSARKSFTLAR